MCSEAAHRPGLRGTARRAGNALPVPAALALSALLLSCDSSGRDLRPAAVPPATNARTVKITNPRQSPRVPFDLRLEAEEKDPGTWELLLHLRSARGGGSEVEFFLPDDAELLEGSLRAEFFLDPGAPRTERILARIPSEGYCALAASAVVAGRREEAYAEFGERPGAEAKGLRIRTRAAGERILRIGPTDEE